MNKFDPTKSELVFRLAFSLAGLALMLVALAYRGVPQGPALVEVVGVAGVFFGASVVWNARKLIKGEYSDGL